MRLLSRASVRHRIAALLAVLVTLWLFAAWVSVRESLNLFYITYLEESGTAAEEVVNAVQHERELSVVVLAGADGQMPELIAARATTDEQAAAWRDIVDGRLQRLAADDALATRYDEFGARLDALDQLRGEVDAGALDRLDALDAYTEVVDAGFAVYRAMSNFDDPELAKQVSLLIELSQARELLVREDTVLAGAHAAGEFTQPEIATFAHLVGGQRLLYEQLAGQLMPEIRSLHDQAIEDGRVADLRRLEDRVVADAPPGEPPPVSADDWDPAASHAITALRDMENPATDVLVQEAMPVVIGILVRLVVAGFLGLVAVILSVTTGRTLVRQLEQVRDAARDLSSTRLPRVVQRLRTGVEVDVATEAPPVPDPGGHETGQLAAAFNSVQEAAVEAAVGQADLRRGVRDVFLSLARRTQSLVRRQLKALDEAEQREADPDKLAELFRIDHLATRMRRNAENLIVLSGASTGRTWREPVPMVDVVRGSISEVEDYTRVNIQPVEPGALAGQVVGDVIHLLAELVENALSFSPPYAQVTVSGQRVARGFAVEVEDRGLGMSDEELADVNRKLAEPPDFDLADASHLGHYVVAKLAERHGIQIQLRRSPYGGVSAIVLIPSELIMEPATGAAEPVAVQPAATQPAAVQPVPSAQAAPPVAQAAPAATSTPSGGTPSGGTPSGGTPSGGTPSGGTPSGGTPSGAHRTPAGLPWRVRQTSMPKQLQASGEPGEAGGGDPIQDPEAVRRKMSAFQRGTAQGRRESTDGDRQEGQER